MHPWQRGIRSNPQDRRALKLHTFHPEAAEEYAAAADYYFKIQPELGGRFYDEIERLIETVCRQPDRVWIVAVLHCKQRPGYWKHRLEQ